MAERRGRRGAQDRSRLRGTRGHGLLALGGAVAAGLAAAFVRAYPGWFDGGLSALILFAATLVLVAALVLTLRLLVPAGGLVDAVGTVCAGALVLDGLLMGFASGAYGAPDDVLRHAGAWLLFGSGAALGLAVLFERRPVERRPVERHLVERHLVER